jgi:hypothetical protein
VKRPALLAALLTALLGPAAVNAAAAPRHEPAPRHHPVPAPVTAPGCDPLGGDGCLFPWPNDYFTRRARTATGRQLDLTTSMMPRNTSGVPIEPSDRCPA